MNLSRYHLSNPVSPQLATQAPPLGSISLQQSSVVSHLDSIDSSSPAEKNFLCRQGYQLIFAASLGKDAVSRQPIVALFKFSLDFKELFSIPTNTEHVTVFCSHLTTLANKRHDSDIALERRVDSPFIANVATSLMLHMSWKKSSLYINRASFSKELYIYNYLAPPQDKTSASGRAYHAAKDDILPADMKYQLN